MGSYGSTFYFLRILTIFWLCKMAIEALNLGHVDEVWFVPCGDRVDKKLSISGEIRLKMVHIIVEDFFNGEFPVKVLILIFIENK